MRLIDADEVLKILERVFKKYSLSQLPDNKNSGSAYAVPKAMQEIPTAYDVDKVVEELEKARDSHNTNAEKDEIVLLETYNYREEYNRAIGLDEAIDIVKRGGIDEK